MKRLLMLILCLLLLCGCGAPADSGTTPTADTPLPTEAPTEPIGLYDPGSELETQTGGAVRAYLMNRVDIQGVIPFGNDLLLLSGFQQTTLTKLSGENLHIAASITLDCPLSPEDPSLQANEKGITYFDPRENDLVFLDIGLKEVRRVNIPETVTGQPALSADRKQLYYFTADALRSIDLDSGIDRLVRQMAFQHQFVNRLHCNDTILECCVVDGDITRQLFVSTATGTLLYESENHITLTTAGDCWFALCQDGSYGEKLTGTGSGDVRMLYAPDHEASAFPLLAQNAVVTSTTRNGQTALDVYDLSDGSHPYSITLPEGYFPTALTADPIRNCIWMLLYDDGYGCDAVCRWDFEKNSAEDDTVYLGDRRTAENPDEFGLEACAELARQLSDKHGVQILIWKDAVVAEPEGYTLSAEYQVPVIRDALARLDAALSHYPEGFLAEAVSEMGDGILRIGLVRDISGITDSGSLDSAGGLQFWESGTGNAYVLLGTDGAMEQSLYNELFHIIESRIFSKSLALDDWEKLNPKGFSYDYSYLYYKDRTDHSLTEGETRAFIDFYSMTFPKEDRARVMQYAMREESSAFFTSEIMQKKLLAICKGIREAYGLKEHEGSLLWEQYLAEPIR